MTPTSAKSSPSMPGAPRVRGFRKRVLVALMALVTAVTAITLWIAQRNLAATIERELQREFEAELAAWHQVQTVRHAALVERCRALVRKPRIHAALEDDALDLLYPNSEDELRDIMLPVGNAEAERSTILRARFYRFLDRAGAVIPVPAAARAGSIDEGVEKQLRLPQLDVTPQLGYVFDANAEAGVTEVIATPILSTETGDVIASLVLGFKALDLGVAQDIKRGLLVGERLSFSDLGDSAEAAVKTAVLRHAAVATQGRKRLDVNGGPHLLFYKQLNPGSLYPAAYEISLYSLKRFAARTARLRMQIIGGGLLLLAAAYVASRMMAARLSAPVEQLAADSERSARFSADASHQLKTPVSVLRAGLEELLARDNLTPDECNSIAALIHQTYRLSSLIEDLLLLSRMDSGRLRLALAPVDLSRLIEAALDDLSAIPDSLGLEIESDVPALMHIAGEQRYTAIILQNLLENARKYNRPGGKIRIAARIEDDRVYLSIGNTGRGISPAAQQRVFERFHRGAIAEDVPGYGLGLNLARELARLHEGDLRLVRSANDWTEFELMFRLAPVATTVV